MMHETRDTWFFTAAGTGRHRLEAAGLCVGDGVAILVWGGTQPHIGSVVIAQPRPSLTSKLKRSATSSVVNCLGHKDEAVARGIAEQTAARYEKTVVVTAGIHIDRMTRKDLAAIMANARRLARKIIEELDRRLRT